MKRLMLAVSVIVFATGLGRAADYYVAEGGTGDYSQGNPGPCPAYCSRNCALAKGDVIHVGKGTYTLTATTKSILLNEGVSIVGGSDDPAETVIKVNAARDANVRGIYINFTQSGRESGVTIRNLTFSGANIPYQGAGVCGNNVWYDASNCVVECCIANYKGAGACCGRWVDSVFRSNTVYSTSASPSDMEGCGGGAYGGIYRRCRFEGNKAGFAGGGLAGGGTAGNMRSTTWYTKAYDCTFVGNTAKHGAAVATYDPKTCVLVDCLVVSNTATQIGGGTLGVTMTNCTVMCNTSEYGGGTGWYSDQFASYGFGRPTVYDCTIVSNTATSSQHAGAGAFDVCVENGTIAYNKTVKDKSEGGGVYGGSASNVTIKGNEAYWGGGVARMKAFGCRILDNVSRHYAGGCYSSTNVNCLIAGNSGTIGGGGLGCDWTDCVISNNTSVGFQGGGGYNCRTYRCLVTRNVSGTHGALTRGYHVGDIVVGNVSKNGGYASAVSATDGKYDCTAVNCTIVDSGDQNTAVGWCTLTNCVITGNATDVNLGSVLSPSHCRWGKSTGTLAADAVDCKAADIRFVTDLKSGEGPYSIAGDSPCYNAGVSLAELENETDILGNPRVKYGALDIGACECIWRRFGLTLLYK